MQWISVESEDDLPEKTGLYAVMIQGDSEYIDGHCIYDFDDYQTFMHVTWVHKGIGHPGCFVYRCEHDEPMDLVIAWYGPIEIPPYAP